MKVKKISHIGIAIGNLEEQLSFYKDVLGLEFTGTEEVVDQKVKVAFFNVGETRIELLEPTSEDSPVQKYLDKNDGKPKVHHIAYEVDDVQKALDEAKEKGVRLIDEKPRRGAGGAQIAFLHPKSTAGILTELCEHE